MYEIYAKNIFTQACKMLFTISRIRTQFGKVVQSPLDQYNIRANTIGYPLIKMARGVIGHGTLWEK